MKAGKLFEQALKEADINLKDGTELKVHVSKRGNHLRLVVNPSELTEFESTILERSRKAPETAKTYRPKLSQGERIRTLRKTAGLSLDVLATKAEMSKGSLCSIEKGKRPAGLAVLKKIARAFGIPVGALLD